MNKKLLKIVTSHRYVLIYANSLLSILCRLYIEELLISILAEFIFAKIIFNVVFNREFDHVVDHRVVAAMIIMIYR